MRHKKLLFPVAILMLIILSCNVPFAANTPTSAPPPIQSIAPVADTTEPSGATTTPILHVIKPADAAPRPGPFVYDVDSSGTAPEKRAPYGDSYDINRLERPFQQDMTFISDADIVYFNLSQDDTWYYISIALIGNDPNNALGIDYGVEIDLNHDGFGDYLVWAHPPYAGWSTANVQVFADKNHDTGGLSAEKSDAPFKGDGYETLIFDGNTGQGTANDPDLAWVRANASGDATMEFALKKSLIGASFMMGVVADAGLKDPGKFDYNDRFTEAEAGSPIKDKSSYPLKALYSVDNTCWQAYGFKPTGYEPKLCPVNAPPTVKATRPACALNYDLCIQQGYGGFDPATCSCTPVP